MQKLQQLKNVTIFESMSELSAVYKQTKILLAPSMWGDAFPLVILESKLWGIPVVASNDGGIPEASVDGKFILPIKPLKVRNNQHVVLKQNNKPWEKVIEKLMSDEEFYQKASDQALKKARKFVNSVKFSPLLKFITQK